MKKFFLKKTNLSILLYNFAISKLYVARFFIIFIC